MRTSKNIVFLLRMIAIALLLASLAPACSNKKPEPALENHQPPEKQHADRKNIQLFWDNYRKAQKLKAEGNWQGAAEYYIQALEYDGHHEDALFNLGNMYLEMNAYDKAKRCWYRIISNNASSARAHMQLGRLYLSPDRPTVCNLDSAKLELMTTSDINRIITGPLLLLGHLSLIEGEYAQAESYYLAVTGSDIKNSEAYFLLGYIAWKRNDLTQSSNYLGKAIMYHQSDKATNSSLSEGDTRNGVSYLRPINQSIFYQRLNGLSQFKKEDSIDSQTLNAHYRLMDNFLSDMQSKSLGD